MLFVNKEGSCEPLEVVDHEIQCEQHRGVCSDVHFPNGHYQRMCLNSNTLIHYESFYDVHEYR